MLRGQTKKDYQRKYMERKRKGIKETIRVNGDKPCEVCGWVKSTETHHEGEAREEHILCPNHHALITRDLATLEELKARQGLTGSNYYGNTSP